MKYQARFTSTSAELMLVKLEEPSSRRNYNVRRTRGAEVGQAAWQNVKKPARFAGITLHLDCTKIYLLVLMAACRHRHALRQSCRRTKRLSRKIAPRVAHFPPYVPRSNSKRAADRKEPISSETRTRYDVVVVITWI